MDSKIEKDYFDQLYKEGLSPRVTQFFYEMSRVNQRSLSYFMIMALEELNMYLEQPVDFGVELDEDKETQH